MVPNLILNWKKSSFQCAGEQAAVIVAWASAERTQEMVKGEPGVRDEEGPGKGWPVSGPQESCVGGLGICKKKKHSCGLTASSQCVFMAQMLIKEKLGKQSKENMLPFPSL